MRILVVHNFHRSSSASGDDQVFLNETNLLRKNGNDVETFSAINDTFYNATFFKKIFLFFEMIFSLKSYRGLKNKILKFQPDIVHVHNFFPLLSPSIFYAIRKTKTKCVMTAHDMRLICPAATCLRNNCVCTKCVDKKFFRATKYKCCKQSRIQSFVTSLVIGLHTRLKTFDIIDKIICLNDTQMKLFIKSGISPSRLIKKYNFYVKGTEDIKDFSFKLPNKFAFFYGRLGEEKGILPLVQAWKSTSLPLVIVGDGPLKQSVIECANTKDNIHYIGYQKHETCMRILKECSLVLFPSIWFEGCSMVVVESQCYHKPIISFDIGFAGEIILDNLNGFLIKPFDFHEFCNKAKKLMENQSLLSTLGDGAYKSYVKNFSADENYKRLIYIYDLIIKG